MVRPFYGQLRLSLCCPLQADRFQKTAKVLKRQFWWQNMKMKLVVAAAVILVAVVIFLLICFSKTNCLSSKS